MYHHLYLLADLSFQIGLIGLPEYEERIRIAAWLSGEIEQDPRGKIENQREVFDEPPDQIREESSNGSLKNQEEDDPPDPMIRLVMLNHWIFTIGDRDCYPSVPHGHWNSKTNDWPKLNPYTGCVFSGTHRENVCSRLKRKEMENLWRDSTFIQHCRTQIHWYSNFAPAYKYPNARHGKYTFPKW